MYNGIRFDSGPEIAYYIWLSDNNIEFTYQPKVSFKYLAENGKEHLYIPDFQVGQDFVEIKGDQYLDKLTGKWVCPYDHSIDDHYEAKH